MFCKQFLAYTVHIVRCYYSIHKHSSGSQHAPIWQHRDALSFLWGSTSSLHMKRLYFVLVTTLWPSYPLVQSTVPLQEALDLPLSALKAQQEVAKLLPMALYTLWMQVSAYGEACDSFIKCVIRGDAESALKLRKQEQEETMLKASAEEAEASMVQGETGGGGESDGEMEDTSGDRRKDRASAAASKAATAAPSTAAAAQNSSSSDADAVMQLFALHPLSVELTVAAKGEAPLKIKLIKLKCVSPKMLAFLARTTVRMSRKT